MALQPLCATPCPALRRVVITEGTIQKRRHLASAPFASLVPLRFWLSESVSPMDHHTPQGRAGGGAEGLQGHSCVCPEEGERASLENRKPALRPEAKQ